MKLQEFLSFRKNCFVCGSSMSYRMTDWTDFKNPLHINAGYLGGPSLLKFGNKNFSILANLKHNNFTLYPNESRKIPVEIEGYCKAHSTHYSFESQMVTFDYVEKTWSLLPDIETQEIIHIGQGNIFSVVNSYTERKTTIILSGGKEHVILPLVNTAEASLEQLNDKLRVYLTFS